MKASTHWQMGRSLFLLMHHFRWVLDGVNADFVHIDPRWLAQDPLYQVHSVALTQLVFGRMFGLGLWRINIP